MQIAIVSDTHDNFSLFKKLIQMLNEKKIRILLHAGDLVSPPILRIVQDIYQGEFHFVFGNNEGERFLLAKTALSAENITCHNFEAELEIDERKIYMIHYSSIAERIAKLGNYDLVIGGHDHKARRVEYGKGVFINPGNLANVERVEKSFMVVDLENLQSEKIIL